MRGSLRRQTERIKQNEWMNEEEEEEEFIKQQHKNITLRRLRQ